MPESDRAAAGQAWLAMADKALAAAEFTLENEHLETAANRAYYAMYYAASAALVSAEVALPKKHASLLRLFSHHFVRTSVLDKSNSSAIHRAMELRLFSDYMGLDPVQAGPLNREKVTDAVRAARVFLETVRAHIAEMLERRAEDAGRNC